jgi:hypothetical protein
MFDFTRATVHAGARDAEQPYGDADVQRGSPYEHDVTRVEGLDAEVPQTSITTGESVVIETTFTLHANTGGARLR